MKRIFAIAIIALSTQVYAQTKETKSLETLKSDALNKIQKNVDTQKKEVKDPFADLNLTEEQKAKIEALFQAKEDYKTKELKEKAGAKHEEAKERVEAAKEKLEGKKEKNKKKQAETKDKIASKKAEIKEKHEKNKKELAAKKDTIQVKQKEHLDEFKNKIKNAKPELTEEQKAKLETSNEKKIKLNNTFDSKKESEFEKELENILTADQLKILKEKLNK